MSLAPAQPSGALIVQNDGSILLDTHTSSFEQARAEIVAFTELEKALEHFYIYRITALSIWNAASCHVTFETIQSILEQFTRYPIPTHVFTQIQHHFQRYGQLSLLPYPDDNDFYLISHKNHPLLLKELASHSKIRKLLTLHPLGFLVAWQNRGTLKQELIKIGWPVQDLVPLKDGAPLAFALDPSWTPRIYQHAAVQALLGNKTPGTGFGVICLPCGAGKTIVAMLLMYALQTETLILTANTSASRQWIQELLQKTTLKSQDIGEYSGQSKSICPVTVATYQILTWRASKDDDFVHFHLFKQRNWGLVIYDETHLLPAPVFRVTAEIQSIRRAGLTATLVREDGLEHDIFSLVGPKRYDVPWLDLEKQGFIAHAVCKEIRISLPPKDEMSYLVAEKRHKIRIAACNPNKIALCQKIVANHPNEPILIIGQYIDQLHDLAKFFQAPIITGKTKESERQTLYNAFRSGEISLLVVSKVANFSIDLPDASVAIQVSGTFGSRQEEAQRLGRILRPKERTSYFYTLVSHLTEEEQFAQNRQKFLAEQGYSYELLTDDDL
jgi:DNA excision repair protein ERCC-3